MQSGVHKVVHNAGHVRFLCSQASSEVSKIFGAAMLERLPVITPTLPEWEVEHQIWLESFKVETRKQYPAQFTGVNRSGSTEADTSSMWQPAPRTTEADDTNAMRSTNRRLDQRLLLLLKSPGTEGSSYWHLPAAEHQSQESIRESAERALSSLLPDNNLRTFTLGNAPAASYSKPDSRDVLFYVKMQLLAGTLAASPPSGARWQDYAWVAADELPKYLTQDETQTGILQALM